MLRAPCDTGLFKKIWNHCWVIQKPAAQIIYLCCDRNSGPSLKSAEQERRYARSIPAKVYDVSEQYVAPDPKVIFLPSQQTKKTLWSSVTNGQRMSNWSLFLAQLIYTWVMDIDVIAVCQYYGETHLSDLAELWVKTTQNTYLPIHEMVMVLGPSRRCAALCLQSDWQRYNYHTLNPTSATTDDILNRLRAHKFLSNKSTLLKLLPPTEDTFLLHPKRGRSCVNFLIHIAKPDTPASKEFGCSVDNGKAAPIPSTKPAWPVSMNKTIPCGCAKSCRCQGLASKYSRLNTLEFSDTSSESVY